MVSRSSLHPLLRLEVGGVKVRVQQDDGKGQDKDGVRGVQFAEIMPGFPGGSQSMLDFIKNNLNYPDFAKENNIEGKVYLKFVVRSTGEIDNIQIARGVHKVLDTAAIELVKKMPRWNPGVQNGKTVPVYFILPVVFRLD